MKTTGVKILRRYVDTKYSQEKSLFLRYRPLSHFEGIKKEDIKKVHIREGSRIINFFDYHGVPIYLADESTFMAAGNFKTLEACFTIAYSKKRGYKKLAFSSGANLGSALTLYGQKCGIETFFFQPKAATWKLDNSLFHSPTAHLIAVDKPEKEVKYAARAFAKLSGAKHVPKAKWRYFATGMRAMFVFEYMLEHNIRFDWINQAVCAGYGPVGFYNCAKGLIRKNIVPKGLVPGFLGVQQAGLCPIVKAWQHEHSLINSDDVASGKGAILSPSLYNTNPDKSYPLLYKHLVRFGGHMISINAAEYARYLPLLLKEFAKKNIQIAQREIDGENRILENAGLIGLAGCLKAIDKRIVNKGENVLSFFTGGAGSYSKEPPKPEFEIHKNDDILNALKAYIKNAYFSK